MYNLCPSCVTEYDECTSVDHGCEQFCINTLGGYDCACKVGFELHSDNKHCEGLYLFIRSYFIFYVTHEFRFAVNVGGFDLEQSRGEHCCNSTHMCVIT